MNAADTGALVLCGSSVTESIVSAVVALTGSPRRLVVLDTPYAFAPEAEARAGAFGERVCRLLEAKGSNPPPATIWRTGPEMRDAASGAAQEWPHWIAGDWLALGPGSPTYVARHLRESPLAMRLKAGVAAGATLLLSADAATAWGSFVLPRHEIVTVGRSLHWQIGIDWWDDSDFSAVIVPYWNPPPAEEPFLDVRRSFLGVERFERLVRLLPSGQTMVGIDVATAILTWPGSREAVVIGHGSVHVGAPAALRSYAAGERFSLVPFPP